MKPRDSGTVGFPSLGSTGSSAPDDVSTACGRERSPGRVFMLFWSKVVTFNTTNAEARQGLSPRNWGHPHEKSTSFAETSHD